jgi:hypothetical protein
MKLLFIGVFLLLVCQVWCKKPTTHKDGEEDPVMNFMLDNIMAKTMASFKDTIDPLAIAEKGFDYKRGFGPLTASASARLLNIKMTGLSNTIRNGNADVSQPDEITSLLTFNVLMSNLTYSAQGEIAVLGFKLKRNLKGKLTNVHAKISVKYRLARDILEVSNVKVIDLKNLHLRVSGGSFVSAIADSIVNHFIRLSISYLSSAFRMGIELALTNLVQAAIDDDKTSKVLKGIMD